MHFDDADAPHLKRWVVRRLEDISDADSDVLADYVLALVKSDEPDQQVRANCIENLEDFLKEHTSSFVDDVFKVVREKSYLPGRDVNKPIAQAASRISAPTVPNAAAVAGPAPNSAPSGSFDTLTVAPLAPFEPSGQANGTATNGQGTRPKKRSWNDREAADVDSHSQRQNNNPGERAYKQMRRGGSGTRGGRGGGVQNGAGAWQNMQSMPSPPAGFPQLDPNNPMAAMMAMQAMGFPGMPGFGQFPPPGSPHGLGQSPPPYAGANSPSQHVPKKAQRCRDYDTKGFCAAGSKCPYEHGTDRIVMPGGGEEYDPQNASLGLDFQPSQDSSQKRRGSFRGNSDRGRGRGRGRGSERGRGQSHANRGGRASFSLSGPTNDTRITTIVVEQIPEEKFADEEVRNFFSEFGTIEEITMQPYKRLALVKFSDHASARQAYESPKVVFDNRFVKVFWYKPETDGNPGRNQRHGTTAAEKPTAEDEEMLDPEEFEKKQAEAQRAHEEKAKKLKEAETAKEELDKRIKAQAEERKKLMERLASKIGTAKSPTAAENASPDTADLSTAPNGSAKESETAGAAPTAKEKATEALRAKLAELEAEAEAMGLSPEEPNAPSAFPSYARGRGGYRGGYRGYDPSFRGRGGRGGWRGGAHAGGAVARLDNRPKTVSVTAQDENVDFADESKGEALRAHLYTNGGAFASIQPPADTTKKNQTIVTFHERYVAEMFIASTQHTGGAIPGIGSVELNWVANPPAPPPDATAPSVSDATMAGTGEGSTVEKAKAANGTVGGGGDGVAAAVAEEQQGGTGANGAAERDVDYDVAEEDEDRWMR